MKAGLVRWRTVVFALGIAGAVLETLSTQLPRGLGQQLCAWMGAAFLAIVPVLTQRQLKPERTRAWARARSASEGIKSEIYLYFSQAEPYDDPGTAEQMLRDKVRKIDSSVDDLARFEALAKPGGSEPPGPLTPGAYIEKRVRDQIDGYYPPKSTLCAGRAERFRAVELVLAVSAAAVAAAAGVFGGSSSSQGGAFALGAWVAVLTTVGGAITAHIAASRYDEMVTSYLGTARRLEYLATGWPPAGGGTAPSTEWSRFVHSCENTISTENQGWMAKWVKEEASA